jgi:hypothetical protein
MALRLNITVRAVREATEEEVDAGSVGDAAVTVLGSAPVLRPGGRTIH